jgi:hypothetical protein
MQLAACLGLDNEFVVDEQIQALYSKPIPLVHHLHSDFASHAMPTTAKLLFHCPDVEVLEKTVSERIVNLEERPNSGMRKSLFDQPDTLHPLKIPATGTTESPNHRPKNPLPR